MLSKDAKIFEKGSAPRSRMVEYGKLFDFLHIVVVSKGSFCDEELSQNVVVKHEPINTVLESIWKLIFGISTKSFGEVDIVTAQDPLETGVLAYRIAKKLHISLQIQVHADIFSPYFTRDSLKNVIRRWMAKRYLPRADCIRVVSKRIYDSLAELEIMSYESRTTIVPIFLDAQKILDASPALLPAHRDFTVLWAGRFEQEKNPLLALHAFREFIKKVPRARLIIMGDGSLREKLELGIRNYELSNNVTIGGWKDTIAGYYKNADVLLVTSWHEGYGLAMVEARIAGLPVVAPDVGVAKEIGACITGHDAENMAKVLTQIYNKELPLPKAYTYPYANKEEYLRAHKESFEQCLLNRKK